MLLSCTGKLPVVGALLTLATAIPAFAQGVITQTEQDDSIPTANPTGLTGATPGIKVAYGNNADGLYGPLNGGSTGDFDFFKLSANAGQVITVDLKNRGVNEDFDSYTTIYRANGTQARFPNNDLVENDDAAGAGRASKLSWTVDVTGDYYVLVGNWINGPSNIPSDPMVEGTGPGTPGGTGGPYQLFIGLNATAPIVQFNGYGDNPVPFLRFSRVTGLVGYRQTAPLRVSNTGNAAYNLTSLVPTGPDAAKFSVQGLPPSLSLAPGAFVDLTVVYEGVSTQNTATATLDFTSNDPFNLDLPLTVKNSIYSGGGKFTVRQVRSTGPTLTTFDAADEVLAGTNAGITTTQEVATINYTGQAAAGFFGGEIPFPDIAPGNGDNFATQTTGTIFTRLPGFYTFRGYADDGQRLRIDGEEVFSFGGANAATFGRIELTAGEHTLEYTHYEGGGGDNMELTVAQEVGEFFANGETTWELLEAYSGDLDGDELPNSWETANDLNPDDATGDNGKNGDPDEDGLGNFGEYLAGTDPQDPDSDDDLVFDGPETDTGVFVSGTDTGTDPLKIDSDNDGLSDKVENPLLAFVDAAQPGTDPNKVDTDGDGFADLSEITLGTNPKLADSVPNLSYQPLLTENFDGGVLNSTYAFTNSGGAFVPAVTATGLPSNLQAAQLSTSESGSSNNSIAWDQVALTAPQSVRLSFDFRMAAGSAVADGLGIGLFRVSNYGAGGATNPAIGRDWENPTSAGGHQDAVVFGFSIYGTNFIRMTGPAAPGVALSQSVSPFALTNGLFNRVIITGVTNGAGGTMFSLQVIQDVNGAATSHSIFKNVLVPDFNLATEQVRLIGGVRTGGFFTRQDLDNVVFSTASVGSSGQTIAITQAGGQITVTYTGVLQSSTSLSGFADVPGAVSPYVVPNGSPGKLFFRAR